MKYKFNRDFFSKIDTEGKAYFLGLLYADGYNWQKGKNRYVSLSLQEDDKHILHDFNREIEGNLNITKRKLRKVGEKIQYYLQINSKKLSEDLVLIGCEQNKTKTLQFPTDKQVPKRLIPHFIRGYFDGDGSVWEGERKEMIIKDKKSKYGERKRVVHNVKFNITGTPHLIIGIQNILCNKLLFSRNKLNTTKNMSYCVQLEYSGRIQMEKFYRYIYKNANLYFERKRKKFEQILKDKL